MTRPHRDSDAPCRILPWDTDFFGFTVARVNAERLTPESAAEIDIWCREHGVRCLYFLADSSDAATVRAAEAANYDFVDVRLTLEIPDLQAHVSNRTSEPVAETIRPFMQGDVDALVAIARVSYTDSRYYFDLHFDRQKCDALYETWLLGDCIDAALIPAHHTVFVMGVEGQPAGFVTCHVRSVTSQTDVDGQPTFNGEIGLVGVAENARGHGLASQLVNAALRWFAEQSCEIVTVVTQGRNVSAQRVYQRCGFITQRVQWWYHKWFED